jgi:4'-phosphopantetheinyl transferase
LQNNLAHLPNLLPNLYFTQAQLNINTYEFDRLWGMLCLDERDRANRLQNSHHRRNFVAARGNLREILGAWLDCQPEHIQFGYGDRGKPFVQNHRVHFNLAHSQDLAIYVISDDCAVGIDLEYVDQGRNVTQIAKRYFSETEQALIIGASDRHAQQQTFFKAWTLKEAYAKATGQGIANILHLDIAPLIDGDRQIFQIGNWQLKLIDHELAIAPNFAAAICWGVRDI